MGTVILPTSPWTFYAQSADDGSDTLYLAFSVTFTGTWAPTTTLTGGQTFRAPSSPWTRVAIGALNSDGTVPAGTKVVPVPLGTTNFTQAQLNSRGLTTIADITTALQITAES